jgi:hypothetical protein
LLRKHGEKETRKFGMDDVFQSNSRLKQTRENGKEKINPEGKRRNRRKKMQSGNQTT